MKKLLFFLPMIFLIFTSCATALKSTLLTGGIGLLVGAGMGAIAGGGYKNQDRIRNISIGSLAGGIAGTGLGYLGHQLIENRELAAFENAKKEGLVSPFSPGTNPNEPVLLSPKIESRFVEEQVRGNVYIPAHYEYIIVEPAKWSR